MKFKVPLSLTCFLGLLLIKTPFLLAATESVSQGGGEASGSFLGNSAVYAISAALAIGLAVIGGALGQGKLGASAMEGIARNPQAKKEMFVPFFLGFVLIESLVIYALVVAIMILN